MARHPTSVTEQRRAILNAVNVAAGVKGALI
jgi:hypothetical protein